MANLLRVSIVGAMPGGEKWSINPIFAFPVAQAVSTNEAQQAADAAASITQPADLRAWNPNAVTVTGARVEARDYAGGLESVAESVKGLPEVGNGTNYHPYQTSVCFSLRTADSTARGKGRLYWPACGIAMNSSTLRISSSALTTGLAAFKVYMTSLQTAIRSVAGMGTVSWHVWSRANATSRLVLSISAGDVADTQRRRRDSLIESYSTVTLP